MSKGIKHKIKIWIANQSIDFANKFASFSGEPFTTLRRIKKSQEKDSKETFEKTRPPQGVEFRFLYFRLIEVFQLEDLGRLSKGIKKLFPGFADEFFHGEYRKNLLDNLKGIVGGSWINVGILYRDKKGRFFGEDARLLNKLPEEVDFISVELHQVLPSIFVLTFDVHLTEQATKRLIDLQSSIYKEEIEFRHVIPLGSVGGGYSKNSAERIMRREVLNWLSHIRYRVEETVGSYISGYFLQQKPKGFGRLPAIEVYAFTGVPSSKAKLTNWIKSSITWLTSLGFDLFFMSIYTNGKLIYIPKREKDVYGVSASPANRLIVLQEPYLRNQDLKTYHGDIDYGIADQTRDLLSAMLPHFSIYELVSLFQADFEEIRSIVYESMKPRKFFRYWLGRYIKLNDVLMSVSILYDRVIKELELEQQHISRDLTRLEDLMLILDRDKDNAKRLNIALQGGLDFKLKLLKEHISLVSSWLSQYLTLRNIAVTYILAFVAGIVAVISVLLTLFK